MNESHQLDLMRINEAMVLVTEIAGTLEPTERLQLDQLSCLIWLCQNKLGAIMTEIQARKEALERAAPKATLVPS